MITNFIEDKVTFEDIGNFHQIIFNSDVGDTRIVNPRFTFNFIPSKSDGIYYSGIWQTTGSLNTAVGFNGGCGTQNAAISVGGDSGSGKPSCKSEKFNGLAWSNGSSLIHGIQPGMYQLALAGVQNSCVTMGGDSGTSQVTFRTQTFNGDVWFNAGGMVTSHVAPAQAGSLNAALCMGGGGGKTSAERFNGTNWSVSSILLGGGFSASAGAGTQIAALDFGGDTSAAAQGYQTFKCNLFFWSVSSRLNVAKENCGGSGTQNAALAIGGNTGSPTSAERFNGATWMITGNLNANKYGMGAAGTQNAAIEFGGYSGTPSGISEKYFSGLYKITTQLQLMEDKGDSTSTDFWQINTQSQVKNVVLVDTTQFSFFSYVPSPASSVEEEITLKQLGRDQIQPDGVWTATGSLNVATNIGAGVGVQGAALSIGGDSATFHFLPIVEKFNGAVWSNTAALNKPQDMIAAAGTQNAAIISGGDTTDTGTGITNVSQKFNGSAWLTAPSMNIFKRQATGTGSQNSALVSGGDSALSVLNKTEKFNGNSWSLTGSMIVSRDQFGGAGIQNATLAFAGTNAVTVIASVEKFNFNNWNVASSVLFPSQAPAGSGTQNFALCFGGYVIQPGKIGLVSSVAEKYNGAIWSFTSSMNAIRTSSAGCGIQNSSLGFGGNNGASVLASTEKYTAHGLSNTDFTTQFTLRT